MSGKTSPTTPHGKAPVPARTIPAPTAGATAPRPPAKTGAPAEEVIRARAYFLWEAAGHPCCDGVEFWLRAEQELAPKKS
jgi:hypothetical protein